MLPVICSLLLIAWLAPIDSSAQSTTNAQTKGGLVVKGAAKFNSTMAVKGKASFKDVEITGKTKVALPAESIVVAPVQRGAVKSNSLTSENLQDAIDNELAVDLKGLLPGSTWTIKNITTIAKKFDRFFVSS